MQPSKILIQFFGRIIASSMHDQNFEFLRKRNKTARKTRTKIVEQTRAILRWETGKSRACLQLPASVSCPENAQNGRKHSCGLPVVLRAYPSLGSQRRSPTVE